MTDDARPTSRSFDVEEVTGEPRIFPIITVQDMIRQRDSLLLQLRLVEQWLAENGHAVDNLAPAANRADAEVSEAANILCRGRSLHAPVDVMFPHCNTCFREWPCETATLVYTAAEVTLVEQTATATLQAWRTSRAVVKDV